MSLHHAKGVMALPEKHVGITSPLSRETSLFRELVDDALTLVDPTDGIKIAMGVQGNSLDR